MLYSTLRTVRSGSMRGRRSSVLLPMLSILAIAMLAAACGSSAARPADQQAPAAPARGVATAAPTGAETAGGTGGTTSDGGALDTGTGPLIVRTGSLQLEVKELDATLLQARARIIGVGGYVSDSERTNDGDRSIALITYRIPAGRWDEALDILHGLSTKVVNEQTKSIEVTGQVLDLGARIDNLRATERALQAIMAQATKISDILDVQNQLTSVQGQIEQLSTQKAHISDQAALGTLAVTYGLPLVAVAQVNNGFSLSGEFDRAAAQLVQLGQGLAVAAVWLGVVGLPILLGFLLIGAIVLYAVRRLNTSRPSMPADPGVPAATA